MRRFLIFEESFWLEGSASTIISASQSIASTEETIAESSLERGLADAEGESQTMLAQSMKTVESAMLAEESTLGLTGMCANLKPLPVPSAMMITIV